MSGIYVLQCNRCAFRREGTKSQTVVIRDDGSEAMCPQELGVRAAEAVTGKTLEILMAAGRIRYRSALLCLACGTLGYYGRDQLPPEALAHLNGRLTPELSVHEAQAYSCRKCSKKLLYPLYASPGRIRTLLRRLGLLRSGLKCPQCKVGLLLAELDTLY